MAAQALGAARDAAMIDAPGKIFSAADAENVFSDMHLYCLDNDDDDYDASGLPIVVLESALNAPGSVAWANVQTRLARAVRVCSYDRRGYGWSWRGPNPRHVARFADELNELLSLVRRRAALRLRPVLTHIAYV
jgi:pimeloyl-ACP methyl ester carboxylesterase